jgi:hypothetical protein
MSTLSHVSLFRIAVRTRIAMMVFAISRIASVRNAFRTKPQRGLYVKAARFVLTTPWVSDSVDVLSARTTINAMAI